MHSRGWQLHPQPLCPVDHRQQPASSHVTLRILYRSSSQPVFCDRSEPGRHGPESTRIAISTPTTATSTVPTASRPRHQGNAGPAVPPQLAACDAAVMDIISLSDAPAYDSNRVVASVLEGSQTNVRLIRLSPGQALPPHTHGPSDLVFAVEGEGTLDTDDGAVPFGAGSPAFYRGNEELRVANKGQTGLTLLAFLSPPFPPRSRRERRQMLSPASNRRRPRRVDRRPATASCSAARESRAGDRCLTARPACARGSARSCAVAPRQAGSARWPASRPAAASYRQ